MTDLLVVGSGIVGAAAAYTAVREGASVTVVDAGFPGQATAAGAGIVSPYRLDDDDDDAQLSTLIDASIEMLESLIDELELAGRKADVFARTGQLVVASTEEERGRLDRLIDRLKGPSTRSGAERITGSPLTDLWPELRPDLAAAFLPDVARMDGRRLAAAMLADAVRHGAEVIRGRAGIAVEDDDVSISVDGADVAADSVIFATGAWSIGGRVLGVESAVFPDKGQIVHLRSADRDRATAPIINTFSGQYLLRFGDGRVVVGATHDTTSGFDTSVTAGGQAAILGDALSIAPGLGSAEVLETRVGFRPASRDGLPLVGPTAVPSVYLATGLGSWGLTLGPMLGSAVAKQVLSIEQAHDLSYLSPLRRYPSDSGSVPTQLVQTGGIQ